MMTTRLPFAVIGSSADGNSGCALVLLREIVHREMHALEFPSRNRQFARLLGSHRETHRIELRAQLFARNVLADRHTRLELHSFGLELLQPAVDHPLFHFKIGNAVTKQAADTVGLFKQRDTVARACQLLRRCQSRRTRARRSPRVLPVLATGRIGNDQPFVKPTIDDVPFDNADRNRILVDSRARRRLRTEPDRGGR